MIKHHRYGTGYLIEGTTPNVALDIGKDIPADWPSIGDLPVPNFGSNYPLNFLSKLILEALEQISLPLYIVSAPDPNTPSGIMHILKHPRSFLEFKKAVVEALKESYLPRSFKVYLSGPDDLSVHSLIDYAYDQLTELANKKINPAQVTQKVKEFARTLKNNKIVSTLHINITPEYDSRHITHTRFSFGVPGWNVMGHAYRNPGAFIPGNALRELDSAMGNIKFHRLTITTQLTTLYYHTLWKQFNDIVVDNSQGMVRVLEKEINSDEVRSAYAKEMGADPPRVLSPDDPESVKVGSGPTLSTATRMAFSGGKLVPLSQKVGGFAVTSASIRSSGQDTAGVIVSADPNERRWMDAQGRMKVVDALPDQPGSWIPVDKIKPLFSNPKYDIYFAIYYDHPLLRPSSSGQPYWYSNLSHFYNAGKTYGQLTDDTPPLYIRIVKKYGSHSGTPVGRTYRQSGKEVGKHIPAVLRTTRHANLTISRAELDSDKSTDGQEASEKLREIAERFRNNVDSGKRDYREILRRKVGDKFNPDRVDAEGNVTHRQANIPDNPIKKHPEGTTEEDWLAYVNWIRQEGEKKLGLKFKSGREQWIKDHGPLKYQRSAALIRAAQNVRLNRELSGKRDDKGNPTEPFAVYFVEFLMGHQTHAGSMYETYAIPINVVRAGEDMDPRLTIKRVKEEDLKEQLSQFPGISKVDWTYVNARENRGFPYAFITRLSIINDSEKDRMNAIFKHSSSPKIERANDGYFVDGVLWKAYQMLTAMPPRLAQEKFGMIGSSSYSSLLKDDPKVLTRIRRGLTGPRMHLNDFGLSPVRTKLEFTGNPLERTKQETIDPNFGVTHTPLSDAYFRSNIGQTWRPKLESKLLDDVKSFSRAYVVGIERANSYEDNKDNWERYLAQAKEKAAQIETAIKMDIKDELVTTLKRSNFDPAVGRSLDLYIKYAERAIDTPNGAVTIKVPELVERLGLVKYTAAVHTLAGRSDLYSVKAPSEDIAKHLFVLKLLRRSTKNALLGNLMAITTRTDPKHPKAAKLIADVNAQHLAQWAANNFNCIEDHDPKGNKFQIPKGKDLPFDRRLRAAPHGEFLRLNMLRTD
jgi:hypothetical protein